MNLGVLGGGQLGRMLALAGYPLGLRCRFLDPAMESPVKELAELVVGRFDDLESLARFPEGLDAITYEFENVPLETARNLSRHLAIHPPIAALEVSQDRLLEKALFQKVGLPPAPHAAIDSLEDLRQAVSDIGLPAILKTRRLGYDGKGQAFLRTLDDVEAAWGRLKGGPLILEGFVPFDREVSQIAARGRDGSIVYYPLSQNTHAAGVLRLSIAPAPEVPPAMQHEARETIRRVMERLDYVGVLAIEFFVEGDKLVGNEMAPRVHNSGHWTIEGAQTSQFENHLRAVAGWPLGAAEAVGHSAMVNLIGTLPSTSAVLAVPGAHLHLYGKAPRAGRKLGHVTLRADTPAQLRERLTHPVLANLLPGAPGQ